MANKIKRYKSKNHVTINNSIMKEKDVTLKAKGLYALVMSLPDDWDFSIKGLCSITKENYTAVNGAINELIRAGYCRRQRVKENGKYVGCDYEFSEVKTGSPRLDFLNVENPHVENLNDNNINSTINSPLNKDISTINSPDNNEDKKASKEAKKAVLKTHEELQYEEKMKEMFPRIMRMEQPLTLEQAKKLKEKFKDDDLIRKVMNDMENWKKLLKEKVSAYKTIINWCQREIDRQ